MVTGATNDAYGCCSRILKDSAYLTPVVAVTAKLSVQTDIVRELKIKMSVAKVRVPVLKRLKQKLRTTNI